jgi:hypothetical protein
VYFAGATSKGTRQCQHECIPQDSTKIHMASPCSQLAEDAVEGPPNIGWKLSVRRKVRVPCVIHELREKHITSRPCIQRVSPTQQTLCISIRMSQHAMLQVMPLAGGVGPRDTPTSWMMLPHSVSQACSTKGARTLSRHLASAFCVPAALPGGFQPCGAPWLSNLRVRQLPPMCNCPSPPLPKLTHVSAPTTSAAAGMFSHRLPLVSAMRPVTSACEDEC